MDEAVIKFYRRLLKEDFPNSGALDNPTIFIEAVGEKMINCGNTGNYMQLYLRVADGRITEIRYLCACEPAANVAVEGLCSLARGKTLEQAAGLTEESFYQLIGSRDEKLRGKVLGLLQLLKEGLAGYISPAGTQDGRRQDEKISWDGTLST